MGDIGAALASQQQAKFALPEAPPEVAVLATQLWEQAVRAARSEQMRDLTQQHARAVEERAHREVDRARQDAKALRTQLEQLQRERQVREQAYRQHEEDSRRELADVQRALAMQTARADALDQQLARLIESAPRPVGRPSRPKAPTTPAKRRGARS